MSSEKCLNNEKLNAKIPADIFRDSWASVNILSHMWDTWTFSRGFFRDLNIACKIQHRKKYLPILLQPILILQGSEPRIQQTVSWVIQHLGTSLIAAEVTRWKPRTGESWSCSRDQPSRLFWFMGCSDVNQILLPTH